MIAQPSRSIGRARRTRFAPTAADIFARLGEVQVLEGLWNPNMIVIVEFPNLERARTWYRSTEYAFALEMHDKALSRNLILVDGVNQPAAAK